MIRVLIVENSPPARLLIRHILESDPQIEVVGMAGGGKEALRFLEKRRTGVDVVAMDIVMPGMDGLAVTRKIMETMPLPVVAVSASSRPGEAERSLKALEAGAVAIIEKPVAVSHPQYKEIAARMIDSVKAMAEVKVVTRRPGRYEQKEPDVPLSTWQKMLRKRVDLLVIGSSTGGPPVIRTILAELPGNMPFPVLIVQHISAGFTGIFARSLEGMTHLPVHVPAHGDRCLPGHVYLAPDDFHMGISSTCRINLELSPFENGHRPSVSYLFRSAVRRFPNSLIAVLLSGMGNDGAAELKLIKDSGSLTIAQDKESCVVFGMPGEAVKIDAAQLVLPPLEIAHTIAAVAAGGIFNRMPLNGRH
jgi:two-component system chemotaxis response regulator CheB